jgi:spore coat protein U-like protein
MKKRIIGLVVFGLVMSAGLVMADTKTNNLEVTASVAAACSISSVSNIAFGAYDPTAGTPSDAAGNLVFRCVKNTSYSTYVTGTRSMSGGGDTLNFNLYSDAGRTTAYPAATGTGGTAANLSPMTSNIYGRIPATQDVGVASYSATLVATVEY